MNIITRTKSPSKTSKSTAGESLLELLESAKTPEELAEVERLVNEQPLPNRRTRKATGQLTLSSLAEVADLFSLSLQTVKAWRSEPVPMPGHPGEYPIKEIIAWRENKLKSSDIKAAKLKQEFELGEIKLEREKLELAQQKSELVEMAEVERWAAVALTEQREVFMSIPETLGTSLPPEFRKFVQEEADRICRSALIMFRRRLEEKSHFEESAHGSTN